MICRYKPFKKEGAFGVTLFHKDEAQNMSVLGELDGYVYVHTPEQSIQDEKLKWEEVTLNDVQKEALKAQMMIQNKKAFARLKVEDIGDVHDLIADAMKLIEFNMMLTARLAGDVWGTNLIPEGEKAIYAARNKDFLDAVEVGAITLRGDFDDMDTLMARLMSRYSKINEVVRDEYINELKKVGL